MPNVWELLQETNWQPFFFCLLSWCFQSPNGKCKKTRATVRHSNVYQTTIYYIGRWLIQMQPTNIWLNQITTQAVKHNDNIIVSQQLAFANFLWPSVVSRNAKFIHDLTGSQGLASPERCIDSPDKKKHEVNMMHQVQKKWADHPKERNNKTWRTHI